MPTPAPAFSMPPDTKKGLSLPNRITIALVAAVTLVIGLVILFNVLGEDKGQSAGGYSQSFLQVEVSA